MRATLKGIEEVCRSDEQPEVVVLLTGQDYPIKSNEGIRDYLSRHRGTDFMEHFSLPDPRWRHGGLDRFEHWYLHGVRRGLRFPNRLVPLPPRRSFPRGLEPHGGSSYWCLTIDSVRYIHRFVSDHPEFVRFFRSVSMPDELFFQTILLNSPRRERVSGNDLRHIDWTTDRSSPAVLDCGDFPALACSLALFARKFDQSVDERVLDMIDAQLLGRG